MSKAARGGLQTLTLLAAGLAVVFLGNFRPVTATPRAASAGASKPMSASDLGHLKTFIGSPAGAGLVKSHPGLGELGKLDSGAASLQALGALAANLPAGLAEKLAQADAAAQAALIAQFVSGYEASIRQAVVELDGVTAVAAGDVAAGKAAADAFERAAAERAAYAAYGPAAAAKLSVLRSAARSARAAGKAQSVANDLLKTLADPRAASFAEASGAAVTLDGGKALQVLDAKAAVALIDRAAKTLTIDARIANSLSPSVHAALERARARGVAIQTQAGPVAAAASTPKASSSIGRAGAQALLAADAAKQQSPSLGRRLKQALASVGVFFAYTLPARAMPVYDFDPSGRAPSGGSAAPSSLPVDSGSMSSMVHDGAMASNDFGMVLIGLFAVLVVVGMIVLAIRGMRTKVAPPEESKPEPGSRQVGQGVSGRSVVTAPAPAPSRPVSQRPVSPSRPSSSPAPRPAAYPELRGIRQLNADGLRKFLLDLNPERTSGAAREIFRRKINRDFDAEFAEVLSKRRANVDDPALRIRMIQSLGQMKTNDKDIPAGQKALLKVVDEGNPDEVTAATKALLNFADKAALAKLGSRVEQEFVDRYERGNGVRADVARGVLQRMEELRRSGAKTDGAAFRRVDEVLSRKATNPTAVRASRLSSDLYRNNSRYVPSRYSRTWYDEDDDFWTAYWVSGVMGYPYPSNYGMMFYFMHQMNAAQAREATPTLWDIHRDLYTDYPRGSPSYSEVIPPGDYPSPGVRDSQAEPMDDWRPPQNDDLPSQSGNAAADIPSQGRNDGRFEDSDRDVVSSGNVGSDLPSSGPARDEAPDRGSDRTSEPERGSTWGGAAAGGIASGLGGSSRDNDVGSAQDDTCR